MELLLLNRFLEVHAPAPAAIVLELDATDALLHGDQKRRLFHGSDGCLYALDARAAQQWR
ncbi:MAG: hypothetical protein ACREO8_13235 [Luteimonas sp.]